VIRNAGGVITDDQIRSLAISQRLLGTTEIILIHHTDCGMLTFTDDQFKRAIQDDTGIKPPWSAEAFVTSTKTSANPSPGSRRPFIPHKDAIRGFVFDVATGNSTRSASPHRPRSARCGGRASYRPGERQARVRRAAEVAIDGGNRQPGRLQQ